MLHTRVSSWDPTSVPVGINTYVAIIVCREAFLAPVRSTKLLVPYSKKTSESLPLMYVLWVLLNVQGDGA